MNRGNALTCCPDLWTGKAAFGATVGFGFCLTVCAVFHGMSVPGEELDVKRTEFPALEKSLHKA